MHKREISIDVIKILASFAVVCLHIIDIPREGIEQWAYYLSGCAIPLLFMTNGYLLLNKKKITLKRQSIKSLKMLGVIFMWCAIFSILYYISDGVFRNPIESTLNGLFLQKGPMWQFWFIGSLILIHLFLPLFHVFFKHPKFAFFLTLSFFVICFSLDIVNITLVSIDQLPIQSYVPQTFRLWNHLAYFFLGGFLGKPHLKKLVETKISWKKHLVALICLSIFIVWYQVFMGKNFYGTTYAEFYYDNFFVICWNVTLFTFVNRLKVNNTKIIKIVEEISVNTFGVYAMHIYLLALFALVFDYRATEFVLWMPILIFSIGQVLSMLLRMNKYTKELIEFK